MSLKGYKQTKKHRDKVSKALIGRKLSEETIQKIAKSRRGRRHSKETKRKISIGNRGKKLSERHKQKLSEIKKGKLSNVWGKHWKLSKQSRINISRGHKGKKSYLWRGGITDKNAKIRNGIEYRLWREAVFARDGWICQKYGTIGGELEAHHIHNFADNPELRFAIDNGITLSKKAHDEFHRKYGIKNNNLEQIKKFIKG